MKSPLARSLVYLYLLRFALLLWLLPLILLLLDSTVTAVFTRGIFTPEYGGQYLCVTFFTASTGIAALLAARLTVANGTERFGIQPPDLLDKLLGEQSNTATMRVLILSQVPAMISLAWICVIALLQDVPLGRIAWGVPGGLGLALGFWLTINSFYLWAYDSAQFPPLPDGSPRPPKELLFPNRWNGFCTIAMIRGQQNGLTKLIIHRAFRLIARFGPGYADQSPLPPGRTEPWPLWEGHAFSIVGFSGLFLLYVLLLPLTAPLRLMSTSVIALVIATLVALVLARVLWAGQVKGVREVTVFRIVNSALLLIFVSGIWILYFRTDTERFPTLSFLFILLTLILWLASALAFLFDRYRLPISAIVGVPFILFNSLFHPSWNDRYFATVSVADSRLVDPAPNPAKILQSKEKEFPGEPLIIVTATGGGLHAAGWTAQILGELESAFQTADIKDPYSFHRHLLLISSVSGGSVGIYSYLRELSAPDPFNNSDDRAKALARMENISMCSSLDAVGWGLTYFDFWQAITGLPPTTSGHDGYRPRLLADRSWALSAAFARNLKDYTYCQADAPEQHVLDPEKLTLHNLLPGPARNDPIDGPIGEIPAFTMNTTSVELGARFLLANYQIPQSPPQYPPNVAKIVPAESFLHVYGEPHKDEKGYKAIADLPLSTAALLSATFPYVSTVSRISQEISDKGFHFADGGYFDNDGTSSAIEFLYSAIGAGDVDRRVPQDEHRPKPKPSGGSLAKCRKEKKSLKQANDSHSDAQGDPEKDVPPILLIEIRDGDDISSESPNSFASQQRNAKAPLNTLGHLEAPVHSFWMAGHESDTLRNRRELAMAVDALGIQSKFEHIVVPFIDPDKDSYGGKGNYALSWALTPRQRNNIGNAGKSCSTQKQILAAVNWIRSRRASKM